MVGERGVLDCLGDWGSGGAAHLTELKREELPARLPVVSEETCELPGCAARVLTGRIRFEVRASMLRSLAIAPDPPSALQNV